MDDLAAPSLAELDTAEAICQLKTHQSSVEPPMNGISYGPKRNSFAAEQNYGQHTLQQQTSQLTPHTISPALLYSTNLPNPSADNYGTFNFYGNSSQAFPWSAKAFENHFPQARLQTQPIAHPHEARDQYLLSQYGQPQYGRPQYGHAQHVEHSPHTNFPHILGPFQSQRNHISQDAAAAAQQHSIKTRNLTQANGSRKDLKRKYSDGADETNTNTKRRRRIGPHAPSSANDPLNDNPPAPVSDDELERRAVHVFNTDPWLWSVSDVYFALTNVRSYDLRQLDNPDLDDLHLGNLTPPHPHIGLILIKFIIDGPKLLVNVTQPWLMGLGITRADHLAATRFVLDKIRLRSPTYQHHQKHILNPIPMLSTQTAGPQSPESRQAVLDSIRQQIATKPLKDGETRNYHLVFD